MKYQRKTFKQLWKEYPNTMFNLVCVFVYEGILCGVLWLEAPPLSMVVPLAIWAGYFMGCAVAKHSCESVHNMIWFRKEIDDAFQKAHLIDEANSIVNDGESWKK